MIARRPHINMETKLAAAPAEEWRPVVGYEGYYEVSNLGRVKSIARIAPRRKVGAVRVQERILTASPIIRGGYLAVMLSRNGTKKLSCVHILVMNAFVGTRPVGADICHNDGNSHNSALSNLRYGTRTENCADIIRHGRSPRGSLHWNAKVNEGVVARIRAMRVDGYTIQEIADKYGISLTGAHAIIQRRSWAWL